MVLAFVRNVAGFNAFLLASVFIMAMLLLNFSLEGSSGQSNLFLGLAGHCVHRANRIVVHLGEKSVNEVRASQRAT